MQERVCNGVWSSGASEVFGELQMGKGACAWQYSEAWPVCVVCARTHNTISIIMVIATLVRYSSHWHTAVCTRWGIACYVWPKMTPAQCQLEIMNMQLCCPCSCEWLSLEWEHCMQTLLVVTFCIAFIMDIVTDREMMLSQVVVIFCHKYIYRMGNRSKGGAKTNGLSVQQVVGNTVKPAICSKPQIFTTSFLCRI